MRLKDKVAIITGAGSGMGLDMAETFAREGAKVAVLDVNEQAAQAVASGIGGNALAVGCDVTRARDVAAAIAATTKAFGGVDILVNNAGVSHTNKPVLEIGEDE